MEPNEPTDSNKTIESNKTKEHQVGEDLQIKLSLDESNSIVFQSYLMKKSTFDREMSKRSDGEQIYQILKDDEIIFAKGPEKTIILSAKWHFLGQYGFSPQTIKYYWTWGWAMTNDDPHGLKPLLEKLPDEVKELGTHQIITFADPWLISYILSFLADTASYDYIDIRRKNENSDSNKLESFTAMGLSNLKWHQEVLEPSNSEPLPTI
jgi:hypothetical protein